MLLKRLAKLGLLLSIKESYLLTKNSLGLVWHPYKTLAVISREKDRSQQLLLLALPGTILLLGLLLVWLQKSFLALALISLSLSLFIYLFIWQVRVWLKK